MFKICIFFRNLQLQEWHTESSLAALRNLGILTGLASSVGNDFILLVLPVIYFLSSYIYLMVPMVLNPNGIEPTFLKFDLRSPGAGFIPIKTSNVLKQIKKIEFKKKKSVLCIQKTFNTVFKNGFNSIPLWVQFHAYPI